MSRVALAGHLLQAATFGALSTWLWPRFGPAAITTGLCAAMQLVGMAGVWRQEPTWIRRTSTLTLVGVAVLMGFFVQASLHLMTRFGDDARATGHNAMGALLLALPWVLAFPLWQFFSSRARKGAGAALIMLGFLGPPLLGALADRPVQVWPAQPELSAAAEAAFSRWVGLATPMPRGSGPATVLLTPWVDGEAGPTVRGDGADLGAAIEAALVAMDTPATMGAALVLDLARTSWMGGVAPVGSSGRLHPRGGLSPSVGWRPGRVTSRRVHPRWTVPVTKGKGMPTAFDSVLISASGATLLHRGWSAPPPMDAEAVLATALAGGRMIARNQRADGRFAYTVKGPSGERGGGYNLPRHAGTTWFLARLAARTGDAAVAEAAMRGMAWMRARSTTLPDGSAHFSDRRRGDGKVWAGTTALAALAAAVLDDPLAGPWGHFLANSVDGRGQVRGEMDKQSHAFPEQVQNPYGQGQVTLALAALVAAGHEDLRPALVRAADFLEGDYAPLGGNRLVTLDDHWACISAQAATELLGRRTGGTGVCRAYLRDNALRIPSPDRGIQPMAGPAGGAAEAVVAAAWLFPEEDFPREKHRQHALAYGELFLENLYQPTDAPFLGQPASLLGGFRDSPNRLDVRMDAVQHIGCALLGIEALLKQRS
jgi:hypothetical protein